ncbi:UNVERIFIED_CONTAM: hypothetical protein GTU68_000363 [Idotea baltica]|nr:hypothetical protein [Idotea baltica]
MDVRINYQPNKVSDALIDLPSSKSISNRLLIIDALSGFKSELTNLSQARDTDLMQTLLASTETTLNAKDAGTTYRFLTAYLALSSHQSVTLTGEERMYKRPIGILVDVLRQLGADIRYLHQEGYPPLSITGRPLRSPGIIQINGSISSQFISALLLIGPYIENGLSLELLPPVASEPYITMTIALMRAFGAEVSYVDHLLLIQPKPYVPHAYRVEADWSGACFFYSLASLTRERYHIPGLMDQSLQADRAIADIMTHLGVHTDYSSDGVTLSPSVSTTDHLEIDCHAYPDLVPALVVALGLVGRSATLTSIGHLRYKECDRITALQTELQKVGMQISVEHETMMISGKAKVEPHISINTYRDHRMAMCFSILAIQAPIIIQDAEVVHKSFPNYWDIIQGLGMDVNEVS